MTVSAVAGLTPPTLPPVGLHGRQFLMRSSAPRAWGTSIVVPYGGRRTGPVHFAGVGRLHQRVLGDRADIDLAVVGDQGVHQAGLEDRARAELAGDLVAEGVEEAADVAADRGAGGHALAAGVERGDGVPALADDLQAVLERLAEVVLGFGAESLVELLAQLVLGRAFRPSSSPSVTFAPLGGVKSKVEAAGLAKLTLVKPASTTAAPPLAGVSVNFSGMPVLASTADGDRADRGTGLLGLDDEPVRVAARHLRGAADGHGRGVVDRLERLLGEVLGRGRNVFLLLAAPRRRDVEW